ncbi:MAG: precorrin-6A reductase [Verrucomicrobiota bacterium]|nr:precorrin-6A reductase [Verrucomicrobiota bacterium]
MKAVLLVGGTSETEAIARSLAKNGYSVLVCTATDMPLPTGNHPAIRRRCGRMSAEEFETLMREERIDVVVNAAHPHAVGVRDATRKAAARLRVARVEFMRPASIPPALESGILRAADHREAAQLAMAAGQKILLTIGVNHLAPYVEAARAKGRELVARALPRDESIAACRAAGLRDDQIIPSRAVRGVEDNAALIRKHGVNVLVTKDSGEAGGTPAKCVAARQAGCAVVLVRRPPLETANYARTVPALMRRVRQALRRAEIGEAICARRKQETDGRSAQA